MRARGSLSVSGMPQAWSAAGDLLFQWPPWQTPISSRHLDDAPGEARKIVASEYGEFDPALSPSGRWLAYASNRTGQNEIWVQGYPDGSPVRVSGDSGNEPQWSADGSELFYRRGQAMMAVAVEKQGERVLVRPAAATVSGPFARRRRGGAQLRCCARRPVPDDLPADPKSARTTASIVVVQNFSEELKRRCGALGNEARSNLQQFKLVRAASWRTDFNASSRTSNPYQPGRASVSGLTPCS